jgi:hypothetical protein
MFRPFSLPSSISRTISSIAVCFCYGYGLSAIGDGSLSRISCSINLVRPTFSLNTTAYLFNTLVSFARVSMSSPNFNCDKSVYPVRFRACQRKGSVRLLSRTVHQYVDWQLHGIKPDVRGVLSSFPNVVLEPNNYIWLRAGHAYPSSHTLST